MKKILILACFALLCLTVVNCVVCRLCPVAQKGKCVAAAERKCNSTGGCVTIFNRKTNQIAYSCATRESCNKNRPGVYLECCYTDLCNGRLKETPLPANYTSLLETS